ncbi:MAG TPA: MFS transporter [Hyphomicrobiaceae bacterium]|nr:MFS transporter [Hyphomicrobiaceae bacterium]
MRQSYGWVVVGAGMLMTCVGMGAMLSLGVFLPPLAAETGWSRTGISTAATLNFLFMGGAALVWGVLSDRFGTRIVVLLGSAILGLGLVAASRAESLIQFQLVFGGLVGIAAGSFYAPMMAAATSWLEHRRNLAAALVSAGMGMGSMTMSPLAAWLIGAFDWRTAMFAMGCLAWILLLPVSLLVRRPPQSAQASAVDAATGSQPYPLSSTQAVLTPQFAAIALAHFACCAAHSGPIFHMVSYATLCGLPAMLAVSVFGVAGLAGLGGRIGLGIAADRLGVKPVLVAGLLVQALAVGAYVFVSELKEFYALSVIFGLAYGGVMPLYAVLVRDFFGPRIMGTLFGAVSMFASVGMALGPWAGGYVFDAFASYAWLYLGSFGIGLAAVAIAQSFRPGRAPPRQDELALRPA